MYNMVVGPIFRNRSGSTVVAKALFAAPRGAPTAAAAHTGSPLLAGLVIAIFSPHFNQDLHDKTTSSSSFW